MRTPTKHSDLTPADRAAVREAGRLGLYLLIDDAGLWVVYCRRTGHSLLTYRPKGGYWSSATDSGREKDWRRVLALAARLARFKQ